MYQPAEDETPGGPEGAPAPATPARDAARPGKWTVAVAAAGLLLIGGVAGWLARPEGSAGSVPPACSEALDLAEQVFLRAGDGLQAAGTAMRAAGEFDLDTISAQQGRLRHAGDEISRIGPEYRAAAGDCRAAG